MKNKKIRVEKIRKRNSRQARIRKGVARTDRARLTVYPRLCRLKGAMLTASTPPISSPCGGRRYVSTLKGLAAAIQLLCTTVSLDWGSHSDQWLSCHRAPVLAAPQAELLVSALVSRAREYEEYARVRETWFATCDTNDVLMNAHFPEYGAQYRASLEAFCGVDAGRVRHKNPAFD